MVGLPVPVFDRNQGGLLQAQAAIVEAEGNLQRVELDLRERLVRAYRRYRDARFQVNAYSASILGKAKQNLDLVSAATSRASSTT